MSRITQSGRCARALSLLALLAQTPLRAQTPQTLTIYRVDRPPRLEDVVQRSAAAGAVIDGSAGDADGMGARIAQFVQRTPGDGVPVSQPTMAYVSYDDANLYVVFICTDDPAKVRANVARREQIDEDDQVVVYLDTFRDRKRAYFFAANPRGVQLDGVRTEGQDEDLSFDAVWSSEGRLTADGYVVRMTIPFRSLRFSNGTDQVWGVALGRVIRRNNEEAYWPHITERVESFVPQLATLEGLSRISPGRNIQLNPYSSFAQARSFDDEIPGHLTDRDERIGLDAKIVLGGAVTLDGTLNPDFSQVETDDPQVTTNQRFDVFFPEKRPFFLENAGYFQTPVNLLHSRQIVDPGAGLRLTGKAGRWAVGAFGMNDREPGRDADEPLAGRDADITVVRLQRDLGDESTFGLLFTNRQFSGDFARNYSVDARFRMGDNWALSGQFIRTEGREQEEGDSVVTGSGGLAQLTFDSRHFEYTASYLAFSPDFHAPLGFIERKAMREMVHELQYAWRPEDGAVTAFGPSFSVLYNWAPDDRIQDRELKAEFQIELTGETELEYSWSEVFELFTPEEATQGYGFRLNSHAVDVSTEALKWLGLSGSIEWGTAVNHDPLDDSIPFRGRAVEAEVGLNIRPTPRLRIEQLYAHSGMRLGSQRVFIEREYRTKLNYQFSRPLSLRAIVDYEAEEADTTLFKDDARDREWGFDVVLTYLVNPGTALYLGYTDRYENWVLGPGDPPTLDRSRRPDMSVGRQLFFKLSYLWRF